MSSESSHAFEPLSPKLYKSGRTNIFCSPTHNFGFSCLSCLFALLSNMRFSTIAVALLSVAASASADNGIFRRQDSYPCSFVLFSPCQRPVWADNILLACAIQCTTNADLGGCQVTDYHCLCTNQSFVSSVTRCLYSSCSGDDLQRALTLSQQLCAKVVCRSILMHLNHTDWVLF